MRGLRDWAVWARMLWTEIGESTFKSVPRGWQGVNCARPVRKEAARAPASTGKGVPLDGVAIRI